MTPAHNTDTTTGGVGRHREYAGSVPVTGEHTGFPWERREGGWVRQSRQSLAVVTDTHAWSVTSVVCGTASGQAPTHTDACNAARAVLQLWHEYSPTIGAVDDEHLDGARSVSGTAAPAGAGDGV